jgi:hypothetical protein
MRTRRLSSAIAIASVFLASLACGEGQPTGGFLTTGPTTGARVRLIHALTSSSALDFAVDGQVAATNVPFGTASQYVLVSLAPHQLQARATGTGTVLVDFTRDLSTGGSFSLIPAAGLAQFGALFISDDPTPVTGQARVRGVHVAAAVGPVSVYITAPGADITAATPLVPLLPFGLASDYVQIAPGTYRVRVTRAGSPSEVLVDVGNVTLSGGAVRTVLVTDAPGGGLPTGLSVIVDAG